MSAAPNRRAAVLGASSEIGRRVCRRYLEAGHAVLAFVNSSQLDDLADHPGVVRIRLDLSSPEDVERFLNEGEFLDEVDSLVCLAADIAETSLESATAEQVTRALNVGAVSNFLFIGRVGPAMARRGYGRIVIGSSIGVKFGGGSDSFAYALSRHAAEFIPRAARDWTRSGVLTNVVRIGVTNTAAHDAFPSRDWSRRIDMIPAGRAASPDEVADYLYWHGSESNTYVSGQLLAITGGE